MHDIHLLHIWRKKEESKVIRCVFSLVLKGFLCRQLRGSYFNLATLSTITKQHLNSLKEPELIPKWADNNLNLYSVKTECVSQHCPPSEHTKMQKKKLNRKHYVIRYSRESDWGKSYFEVFQQETLLLLRASLKALNMEKSTGPCVNTLCNKLIQY